MQNNRIQIVDALRGFSLAGIVLVHMVENYVGAPVPIESMAGANQGVLDSIVQGFMGIFFVGKFFALFSFLFGLSFFIQMDKAAKKGANLSGRFLWRLILLLIIGCIHHLFYRGDILTVYALLGIALIPFYKLSKKWILVFSILIFLGIGRFIIFAIFGTDPLFSSFELNPDSPEMLIYFETLKNGTITDVFATNATQGHLMKLDFQLGVFGRGYLTFGFFLLGLLMGKIGFFENYETYKGKMRKLLFWCIGVFLFLIVLAGLIAFLYQPESNSQNTTPDFNSWAAMLGITVLDLVNLLITIILIVSFILIYMRIKGERFLIKFAPYGRMALTNYFMQSVIGTFILYGWGLGYLGEVRNIYTLLIGTAIIILQMLASKWWLSKFQYGPLEWLWRSLTYFKPFPFKLDR